MLGVTSSQPGRDMGDALSKEARRLRSMALHGSALARHQCFAWDSVAHSTGEKTRLLAAERRGPCSAVLSTLR